MQAKSGPPPPETYLWYLSSQAMFLSLAERYPDWGWVGSGGMWPEYVDDGITAGPRTLVESVFAKLSSCADVTGLGEPEAFSGIHTPRDKQADTIAVY